MDNVQGTYTQVAKNLTDVERAIDELEEQTKPKTDMERLGFNKGGEVNSKSFVESFSYNNIENKFNLASYENDVENILINKIFEKLTIYFSL